MLQAFSEPADKLIKMMKGLLLDEKTNKKKT